MSALEWERIRRRSPSVQDFATNFREAVRKLPEAQRAGAYRDTLAKISPLLEQRVAEETQIWVDRGYAPDRALKAATYASLIGRRRALFHDLFTRVAEEGADKVMATMGQDFALETKRDALDTILAQLRPDPLLSHPKPNGEARLRETGFPEWFIQWAVTRKPLDADDILAEIDANMDAGMDGREALRRGLVLAIREFSLDYMMATGVAQGTDFCVVATAVIGALGVALSVASTVVSAVRTSRANTEARQAQSAAEAQWYQNPLSDEEIVAKVAVFRGRNLTRSAAQQALLDYMRSVRIGRRTLYTDEVTMFNDAWRQAEQTQASLNAAAAAQRDLPRKLIAYGVPILGALVFGYALIK